jgi:hypothetical protein
MFIWFTEAHLKSLNIQFHLFFFRKNKNERSCLRPASNDACRLLLQSLLELGTREITENQDPHIEALFTSRVFEGMGGY